MRRRTFLGGLALPFTAAPVLAQAAWPARPVRMVVPLPPGGAADAIPRAVAQHLQEAFGAPWVIENRPGASGTIGADLVAKADPDGYTFLSHTSSLTIQPHMGHAPYELLRDFVPVTQTIAGSYVLVATPSFPAGNLREWIAAVRRAPGRYSYGSHGSGSGPHLAMELLKEEADLFILHVPFRGAAPAMQELLAGRLDMAFETTFAAIPHIRAGRLKAIALGGPRTLEALPGVGTAAEAFPGFDTDGWQGFFAPAGTPAEIVRRVSEETTRALRTPALATRIAELGFRPVGGTPEQFAAVVQRDHGKWGRIVRERRILPD
jgi:tripartite-type tricarboxylate transporter receptor subunit TctC